MKQTEAIGCSTNSRDASREASCAVHIHHTESGSPHAVTFNTESRAFGVIMPIRPFTDKPWGGAPSWVAEIYPNATAETEFAEAAE